MYEDAWAIEAYTTRYLPEKALEVFAGRTDASVHDNGSAPSSASSERIRDMLKHNGVRPSNFIVLEFLRSSTPSLECQIEDFQRLGVRNARTLAAFLLCSDEERAARLFEGELELTELEAIGLQRACCEATNHII